MAGRDLDFYCITSRLAAMSFPAEGLESTYRNHIEDVRGMMDNLAELARYSDTFRGHPLQRTQGTLFVREELRSKFTLKSLGPGWICPYTILESHFCANSNPCSHAWKKTKLCDLDRLSFTLPNLGFV